MAFFGYHCRVFFNQINRTKPGSMSFGAKTVLLGRVNEHSVPAQPCFQQCIANDLRHVIFTGQFIQFYIRFTKNLCSKFWAVGGHLGYSV